MSTPLMLFLSFLVSAITIMTPVIKLSTTITKLNTTVNTLTETIAENEKLNRAAHKEFYSRLDCLDNTCTELKTKVDIYHKNGRG